MPFVPENRHSHPAHSAPPAPEKAPGFGDVDGVGGRVVVDDVVDGGGVEEGGDEKADDAPSVPCKRVWRYLCRRRRLLTLARVTSEVPGGNTVPGDDTAADVAPFSADRGLLLCSQPCGRCNPTTGFCCSPAWPWGKRGEGVRRRGTTKSPTVTKTCYF